MKKRDLKKLALLGLTSGLLLSAQGHANTASAGAASTLLAAHHSCGKSGCGGRAQSGCGGRATAERDTPTTERVQRYPTSVPASTEKLRDQLNTDTKKIYDALPEKGKEMALEAVKKDPTRNKNDIVKSVRDELSKEAPNLKGRQ